jgi:MFS transporter, UMF1 family
MHRWLERIALHRPELRAWAAYDWANSVFMTTILQVFPIYFATVAAADLPRTVASQRFYLATSIATLIVAVLAPLLGAIADYAALKKHMCAVFLGIGVVATGALYLVQRGDWKLAAVLFVLGNIGVTGSLVFYESLLPHVARPHEVDRLCTSAYALGYLSGGLLLALNVWWIRDPHRFGLADAGQATRLSFLSAAVWWLAFSIPLFLWIAEPAPRLLEGEKAGDPALLVGLRRLRQTFEQMRLHRDAFLMLLGFMIYNDGIVTIIRLATAYGTEVGIGAPELLKAILLVQFVGVPAAFGFGALAARIGTRPAIYIALCVYVVISVLGYHMRTASHFFLLALLVATVQGGSQALSRSLFARLVPRHQSSEFFGFFGVFEKFAGVAGPLLFTGSVATTGSSRNAILGLTLFFVVGGIILSRVDIARGERAVLLAEEKALQSGLAHA